MLLVLGTAATQQACTPQTCAPTRLQEPLRHIIQVTQSSSSRTYDAFDILVRLPSGKIISIYRQGLTHAADNGRIVLRESANGTDWSEPRTLFDDPVLDDRNVAGGLLPNGDLLVFWNTWDYVNQRSVQLYFSRSKDGGETWTDPAAVRNRDNSYGPIIVLPDRLAISTSKTVGKDVKNFLQYSTDGGYTWSNSTRVPAEDYEVAYISLGGQGILGFARNDEGSLTRLYSPNLGLTWHVSRTNLRPSVPNVKFKMVSPWIVKPVEGGGVVDLWFAERYEVTDATGMRQEKGLIRSVTFETRSVIEALACFPDPQTWFETSTIDMGYPSVVMTSDRDFVAQFYSPSQSMANLHLIFGHYSPAASSTNH